MGSSCTKMGQMMRKEFWLDGVHGINHSENLGLHVRIILKYLRELEIGVWIRFSWLRLGTTGGLL